MSLEEHIATAPSWLHVWLNWMMVANLASVLFLVRWQGGKLRLGHIEAYAIVAAMIGATILMTWLFDRFGYVRLLGLGHIPFWTPLAIYLWTRLPHHPVNSPFGIYLRIFLATIAISLVFDYVDIARYLAGDRTMP